MTAALLAWALLPIHVNARPAKYTSVAIDKSSPERIFAGTTEGRILRSLDGGATWDEVMVVPPKPSSWGEEHQLEPPHIPHSVTGGAGGRFRAGVHHLQMLMAERGLMPAHMNIYRLLPRINNPPREINSIVVDPTNSQNVFVGAADGVYRSTDWGRSFTRVYGPEAGLFTTSWGRSVMTVAVDPFATASVHAGTADGLYVSHDGGSGFHLAKDTEGLMVSKITFHPTEPGVVFLATSSGLFRSADGGDSLQAVWGRDVGGSTMCVDVAGDQVIAGTAEELILSQQKGEPGTFMMLPAPRTRAWTTCALDPDDPKHMAAGTEDGLYETTDGGIKWVTVLVGTYSPEHYFSPSLMTSSVTPVAPRESPRFVTIAAGRTFIATTNGLYRRDADEPPPPLARETLVESLPPLGELETRARRYLDVEMDGWYQIHERMFLQKWVPWRVRASFDLTQRLEGNIGQDVFYTAFPYRRQGFNLVPHETSFFVSAEWGFDFFIMRKEELLHKGLMWMRLRDMRVSLQEEIRRRFIAYGLTRELHARTRNQFLRRMYELTMQEHLSYLDAVTGGIREPVAVLQGAEP